MPSTGFFNADKAEQTHRLNKISQLPVAGQVIGIVTVAINVAKVALDILVIIATLPCRIFNSQHAPALFKRATVLNRNSVIGLTHHIRYIAIGVLRFIPVAGAKVLHDLKVAPQRSRVWIYNAEQKRIEFQAFRSEENNRRSKYEVGLLTLSTLPLLGMLSLLPLLSHQGTKCNKKTLAAYTITALFPFGGLAMLLAGVSVHGKTASSTFPSPNLMSIDKRAKSPLLPLQNAPVNEQWFKQKSVEEVAPNRLAMVLGDTRIKNTEYEGSYPHESLSYWEEVLNENDEGPIPAGLTNVEKDKSVRTLTSMKSALKMIQDGSVSTLHAHIKSKLRTDDRCYIPLQYIQRGGVPGHVTALVFEKRADGRIAFYVLNVGEGSERNPVIRIHGKTLKSYRTLKRVFHEGVMDSESLPKLIIGWASKVSDTHPMSTDRILRYFDLVSYEDKNDRIVESSAVTSQRAGTCGEQMTRLVLRDLLLQSDRNEGVRKYKRLIAHGKLHAIRAMKTKTEAPIVLLRSLHDAAAHTFLQSYRKGYLTRNEVEAIGELMLDTRLHIEKSKADKPVQPSIPVRGTIASRNNTKKEADTDPLAMLDAAEDQLTFLGAHYQHLNLNASTFSADKRNKLKQISIPLNESVISELRSLSDKQKLDLALKLIDEFKKTVFGIMYHSWKRGYTHERVLHHWETIAVVNFLLREIPEMRMKDFKLDMPVESLQEGVVCHLGHQQRRKDALVEYFKKESARHVPALFNYVRADESNFDKTFQKQFENYMSGRHVDPDWQGLFEYLFPFYTEIRNKGSAQGVLPIDIMRDLISTEYKMATDYQKKILRVYEAYRDIAYSYENRLFHGYLMDEDVRISRNSRYRNEFRLRASFPTPKKNIPFDELYLASSRSAETVLMNPLVDEAKTENLKYSEDKTIDQLTHCVTGDFREASAYPSARVAAIINWIKINGHLLGNSQVQNLIEKGLFGGAGYGNGIKDEPLLHEQFKSIIREQLTPVKFSRLSEILFLIKIGFCIQTHLEDVSDADWSEWKSELDHALLEVVKCAHRHRSDKLTEKRSLEILSHTFTLRGLIYSYGGKLTPEALAESFSSLFLGAMYVDGYTISMVTDEALRRHNALVKPYLEKKDPDFQKLIDQSLKKHLECTDSDEVTAVLTTGKIIKNGAELRPPTSLTSLPSFVERILGDQVERMISKGSALYTQDERFKYEARKLWIHHDDKWWSYSPHEDQEAVVKVIGSNRTRWVGENGFFIAIDDDFKVVMTGCDEHVVRTSPDGTPMYLTTPAASPMTSEFLTALGVDFSQCSFWGKVAPQQQAGAYVTPCAIELHQWNNLILYQDGAKKRCVGIEEYSLSDSQAQLDGQPVDGVIHLTHDSDPDNRLVLIACRDTLTHPFEDKRGENEQNKPLLETQHYFTYSYDSKSGLLQSEEEGGYLHLATVYLSLGMYAKAHLYLNRAPQFTDTQRIKTMIEKLFSHTDHSPAALAFLMRACYRWYQDQKLIVKSESSSHSSKIVGTLIERYLNYSHHKGRHFSSDVQLEDHELETLFDALEETRNYRSKDFINFFALYPKALIEFCRLKGLSVNTLAIAVQGHDIFKGISAFRSSLIEDSAGKEPSSVDLQSDMHDVTKEQVEENFLFFFQHYLNVSRSLTYPEEQHASSQRLTPMGYHPSDALLHRLWFDESSEKSMVSMLRIARYFPAVFDGVANNKIKDAAQNFTPKYMRTTESNSTFPEVVTKSVQASVNPTLSLSQLELNLINDKPPCIGPILGKLYNKVFVPREHVTAHSLPESLVAKLGDVKPTSYVQHTPKKKVDSKELIKERLQKEEQQLQELITDIDSKLHSTGDKSFQTLMKGWEETKNPPTYRDLLLAIAAGDFRKLQDKVPSLSQSDVDTLAAWGMELMLVGSRIDQMKEALSHVEKNDFDAAGTVLYKKRSYDPLSHPMLLYYEYATGHILRDKPDQAQLLIDMFNILFKTDKTAADTAELRRICFEFQAGGGKTKVISVILAARAIAEGKLPIFFSLPQLFDIANQDLHEVLTSVFEHNVCHIDLSLQDTLTSTKAHQLLATLKQKKELGICVVMSPETFHSLNLSWQEALKACDERLIKALTPLRAFLKEEALFLIDESHRNVDPLLIANKAVGLPQPINERERNHLLLAYKMLAGYVRPELKLHEALNIAGNEQALVSDAVKANALSTLSTALIESLDLARQGATEVQIQEAIEWVNDKSKAMPEWVENWSRATPREQIQARLISYTRGLRLEVLPHCLSQVGEMDYGQTSDPYDYIVSPRDHKTPVNAKFESADVAAALTIQDALVNGISKVGAMRALLQQFINEAKEARRLAPLQVPAICESFKEWQKETAPIELESIDAAWLENASNIDIIIARIGREPELIERYLKYVVLPRILVFPEKITSTGKELVTSSWASILFSATMGRKELYPDMELEKNYKRDLQFLAQVFSRTLAPHNRGVHYHPTSSAYELMKRLGSDMANTNGVLDVGFWSKGESSEDWARAFNRYATENAEQMSSFHGALFFKQGSDGTKSLYLWPKGAAHPQKLPSTNLKKLNLASKKFFCIYAPDETTGTDLYLPSDARMIVTVGESTACKSAAQAVMRMRGFLRDPIDPVESQKTVWVIPEALRDKVQEFGSPDQLESIILWMIDNEEKREREALIARAYQEIEGVVRAEVQKRIDEANGAKTKARIRNKHKQAFIYDTSRSVLGMYGKEKKPVPTRKVLTSYAQEFMSRASVKSTAQMTAEIERIITQTEKLVPTVASSGQSLSNATRQASHSVEVVKQQQRERGRSRRQFAKEALALIENYALKGNKADLKNLPLRDSDFLKPMLPEFVGSSFRATPNALNFDKNNQYCKPITFFLLVEDQAGKRHYVGVSYDDALAYQKQLREGHVKQGLKIALFGSGGVLIQNGKDDTGIQASPESLNNDSGFCNELHALALYNGKARPSEWLSDLGKEHPHELRALFNSLKARHIYGDELFDLGLLDEVTGQKSEVDVIEPTISITISPPKIQPEDWVAPSRNILVLITKKGLVVSSFPRWVITACSTFYGWFV